MKWGLMFEVFILRVCAKGKTLFEQTGDALITADRNYTASSLSSSLLGQDVIGVCAILCAIYEMIISQELLRNEEGAFFCMK